MNCQEFCRHLPAAVDQELAEDRRLAFEAHGRACPPCGERWSGEAACWLHVRKRFSNEAADPSLCRRVALALERETRWGTLRRTGRFMLPLLTAAAVLGIVVLRKGDVPSPQPSHDHGPTVNFAATTFLEIAKKARDRGVPMVSPAALEGSPLTLLEGPAADQFLREVFGAETEVMRRCRTAEFRSLLADAAVEGTSVSTLLFDFEQTTIGVYRIPAEKARLARLEVEPEGRSRQVTVERCRDCHVIAVQRGDHVYLVVSSDRDALDRLAASVSF